VRRRDERPLGAAVSDALTREFGMETSGGMNPELAVSGIDHFTMPEYNPEVKSSGNESSRNIR
jgi:hypothetical protein